MGPLRRLHRAHAQALIEDGRNGALLEQVGRVLNSRRACTLQLWASSLGRQWMPR